ncbi:MAG: WbqC family protein, partial [Bacteroidota bacterium]
IKSICKYLDIDTEFLSSKNVYDNEDLNGQNRVIDIVLKEKANHYVNPIGGTILYDSEAFKEKNIELSFLKVDKNLNNRLIIDILMNFNKEEIKNILNQCIIVK